MCLGQSTTIIADFFCCFFFFQAEDGIRDGTVTGVQTCALPISQLCDGLVNLLSAQRLRLHPLVDALKVRSLLLHLLNDLSELLADNGDLIDSAMNLDRKSTRLNSSHSSISYAVFCLKKKININKLSEMPPVSMPSTIINSRRTTSSNSSTTAPRSPAARPRCAHRNAAIATGL